VIANLADVENIGCRTEAEALGKTDIELFEGETGLRSYADDKKVVETGMPIINREEVFWKNGTQRWLLTTKVPLFDEQGNVTGLVGIGRDITYRKQMEADLITAKEKAEESDRPKSAFLANMSHEIRTPLNSIIGFPELLGDDSFTPEQKKGFITHITENGNSLVTIISDIMDLSKMESGQLSLKKSTSPVNQFLGGLAKKSVFHIKGKNIELKVNIADETKNCQVVAVEERLVQVFNSLINNVKFTEQQNLIELGANCKKDMAEFYVKDTGIGIPKEFHEIIFERFRQIVTTKNRKYGGNGLGLAIPKYLVELMGGTIWLDSAPGKGSTFYFTVPRDAP